MTKEQWSGHEQWAWEEIRAGRIADFNKREQREPLDPSKPEGWSDLRRLGSDFLKEILFREPCRSDVPVEGVRVVGAWFPDEVDIEAGHLEHQLRLERCRFEKSAIFRSAKVDGQLDLDGAAIAGKLVMDGLQVGRDLRMCGAFFQEMSLVAAKVDGYLGLDGAIVAGKLEMNGLRVGQGPFMRKATLQEVSLVAAKVDGFLDLDGATVAGKLVMDGLQVGHDLRMQRATFDGPVRLVFARIGLNLDLRHAAFTDLNLQGVRTSTARRTVGRAS